MEVPKWCTKLIVKQNIPKVFRYLPLSGVLAGGNLPVDVIEENRHYFSLSLSEMYLKNRRVLWSELLPLCVAVGSFTYDGKPDNTVPFFVGSQLLKEIERHVENEYIEFKNCPILGPVPYVGGGLSLFAGLFKVAVKGDTLASRLFGFVGDIFEAFSAISLSKYLDVSNKVLDSLTCLLGIQDTDAVISHYCHFPSHSVHPLQLRGGYLVYINCGEAEVQADQLRVKEGRLYGDASASRRFDSHDYCLLRLDRLTERGGYTTLPFFSSWLETQKFIMGSEQWSVEAAKSKFRETLLQIMISPDLTEEDRNALQTSYLINFEKALEMARKIGRFTGVAYRSVEAWNAADQLHPAELLKLKADRAERGRFSTPVVDTFREIANQWDRIPYNEDPPLDSECSEQILEETLSAQVKAIKSLVDVYRVKPSELANAIWEFS